MKSKNLVISFNGVDGAGKTTILRLVSDKLKESGHRVIELRARPSILPILSSFKYGKKKAESIASSSLPRLGKNNSKISSFFRFVYYLVDYIFGQIYVYLRYSKRGYTIVYDRFYYDYIVDPKRANIVLNPKIAKFFLNFIRQPNINIFLYAPAEVILSRKQELNQEDILNLTHAYMALFQSLDKQYSSSYACIENIDLIKTMQNIEKLCQENEYKIS